MAIKKFLTASFVSVTLTACGGGGDSGQQGNGVMLQGTAGNDSWSVVGGWTGTIDGLGGTDTLNLGTSLRSAYSIHRNADNSVAIDTISGASTALHATLVSVEQLVFDSGRDVMDLTKPF
jgi:hypothetical protein